MHEISASGRTGRKLHGLWAEMPTASDRVREQYCGVSMLVRGTRLTEAELAGLLKSGQVEGIDVEGYWLSTRSALQRYLKPGTTPGDLPARLGRAR